MVVPARIGDRYLSLWGRLKTGQARVAIVLFGVDS